MASILTLTLTQNVYGTLFKSNLYALSVSLNKDAEVAKKINQRLANVSILGMKIQDVYVYPVQPTENGTVNQDTRIRMPSQITVQVSLPTAYGDDYTSSFEAIAEGVQSENVLQGNDERVFNDIETAIRNNYSWTILSKNKVYNNMYLITNPTDLTPETVNRPVYNLTFIENIIETGSDYPVKNPIDENKSITSKLYKNVEEKWNRIAEDVKKTKDAVNKKIEGLFGE